MIIMDKFSVFAIRESHESIIKFWDCPVVEPIAYTDCECLYLILLNDVECTEIMKYLYKSSLNPGNKPTKVVLISAHNGYNPILSTRNSISERKWLYITISCFRICRYRGFLPLWKRV